MAAMWAQKPHLAIGDRPGFTPGQGLGIGVGPVLEGGAGVPAGLREHAAWDHCDVSAVAAQGHGAAGQQGTPHRGRATGLLEHVERPEYGRVN